MTASAGPVERRYAIPGLTLAAREWGAPGGRPLLAVHGWMDNAASFDLLAPLLPACHIVAPDCAGHGLSDYRSADSAYNIWQDVGDLLAVADHLGWQRFCVMGHSRGAGIATLLAASFPERIERLVLIEGGIPIPGEAADAPANLALALRERAQLARDAGRVFPTWERAVAERARGFVEISHAAAEILARRSLCPVDGGYQWRADRRLKGRSELRLTPEILRAFVSQVAAPTLFVEGQHSGLMRRPIYEQLLPEFRELRRLTLPGGHHLHLEGAEVAIAAETLRFLASGDSIHTSPDSG